MINKNQTSLREKRLIMAHLLGWTYEDVFLKNPSPEDIPGFSNLWERYLSGAPLARLIGQQTFRGLSFDITPDVLEPRADSELILDVIHQLNFPSSFSFLDLGIGSGCLTISILKEFPEAKGFGVDISLAALGVAKFNAIKHQVDERITWLQSNWLQNVPSPQSFDLIISNPPYIGLNESLDKNVTEHDPHLALYGGEDGLDCYREILKDLLPYCHQSTYCLFEIGHQQHDAILKLLEMSWIIHSTHQDCGGHQRVVVFTKK